MVLVEESVPTQVNVVNLYQQAKPNQLTTAIVKRVFTPGTDSHEENQPWTNARKFFQKRVLHTWTRLAWSNRMINYFLKEPQYIEYLSQPFILNIDIQVEE